MRRPLPVRLLRHGALLLICAWSQLPITVIVLFSVRPPRDIFAWPLPLLSHPTVENYIGLWQRWPAFCNQLFNSFVVTVGATVLTIVVSTLAGRAYSRYRSRLLTLSAFWTILVRLFPPIVITLPLFPLANALGLNDTW
jgi:multiple sugar transport system permease protein